MAILNNTSLGFSTGESDCDCQNSDFCQVVVKEDNPVWQIVSECDELTGINNKLPCESNLIATPYFDHFTAVDPTHVSVGSNVIDWLGTATSGSEGTVNSAANFLTIGKFYVVKFTIVGHTQGTMNVYANSFSLYTVTGNGNWTFVIKANDDILSFIGSFGETAFDGNMINLFIGCLRSSQLYDIVSGGGEGDTIWSFPSQTKGCKGAGFTGEWNYLDNSVFVAGQTYKICFTISELTAGQLEVLLGSNSGGTFTTNGRFCIEIVYNGAYSGNSLSFLFDADFDGCISDITVNLVPTINVGIFDENGNEIEGGLVTETIENTLKVTLDPDLPEGCYTIGVADSCSNYKKQFYGNVLADVEKYSTNINTETGVIDFDNAVQDGDQYCNSIKWLDAVCCDKLYDFIFEFTSPEQQFQTISVTLNVGGTTQTVTEDEPANDFQITFTDIQAGCENTDIELTICYVPIGAGVDCTLNLETSEGDMIAGQFCPEFMSSCLKIVETAESTCDTLLIKYRSEQNAFGFDYTSTGYTMADGFYNMLRVPAKLWKASYPKTKEVQKLSTGRRNPYYTDIDKKYVLSTGLLPEYIHDALSIAVDHETLIIEGREFVSEQTDYSPQWNKSSALAPVEVELFLQKDRTLSTFC